MFGEPQRGDAPNAGWTIVLFKPDVTRASAQQWLDAVRAESGLASAYLLDRGGEVFIAVGSYPDPTSRDARADFERVRAIRVGDARPYANARLLPVSTGAGGATPEWDLRNVREAYGPAAKYSLQVGLYRKRDNDGRTPSARELDEIRSAAESAVRELRDEGELAFYWHTPFASLVTIGVFGDGDLDTTLSPPEEGPRIREVQARHPHNLINGMGAMRRGRTADGRTFERMEPSVLIEIPAS